MPEVKEGNLYRAKGGRDTHFWYVISIKETCKRHFSGRACVLGLDKEMNIVSAQTYGVHSFMNRPVVDHIPIEEIAFSKDK